MIIPPKTLAKAEILNARFLQDGNGDPSDDAIVNTVTWLIDTFTFKRSLELALAIGRKIGEQHCIRMVNDDGSTSFALIAEEPHQVGAEVTGNGISIFGSANITDIVQGLSGEVTPRLQVGIAISERRPGRRDETLVHLASLLPWYRKTLGLPVRSINTKAVVKTCIQLGMPKVLLEM